MAFIELISCPMRNNQHISAQKCVECQYHHAIMLIVDIEHKDPMTNALVRKETVRLGEAHVSAYKESVPDAQLTPKLRYMRCDYPRQLPIEQVEI